MSERKSILLLGGSQQQVIAIDTARRLGFRTVLCDYLPDNPGQHHADVFYQESTTDLDTMLAIAEKERVSGVLAYSSDPAAITAAYVADKLGLPSNSLNAVRTLSEKHLFRKHLAENGFPCPKARELRGDVSAEEVLEITRDMQAPVVLKPTDSSGSKGVSIIAEPSVDALDAALEYARGFSRNNTLVVEEFIEAVFPRVIGGDVFVVDGRVVFWGLMSCFRDEGLGGLVPVGERYPSGLTPAQDTAVRDQIQKLVDSLDISFGEFNIEVIVGRDDTPYFLEMGARAGGNMLPIQLSDISGVDLVEANVRCAMGDFSMDTSFDRAERFNATYVLHSPRDGRFAGVGFSAEIEPHVYRRELYVQPGDEVWTFDGANKALGILFMNFDSEKQMETMLDDVAEHIRVSVE